MITDNETTTIPSTDGDYDYDLPPLNLSLDMQQFLDEYLYGSSNGELAKQTNTMLMRILGMGMVNTMHINSIVNIKLPCLMPSELDISKRRNFHTCPSEIDSEGMCWPAVPYDSKSIIPCFPYPWGFDSQMEKKMMLAERYCAEDGIWNDNTPHKCGSFDIIHPIFSDLGYVDHIWTSGYLLSLVSLIIGITIFMCFKKLRTRQNMIHANLFSSYMLTSLQWFFSYGLVVLLGVKYCEKASVACKLVIILELFFNLTTLAWMIVGGLYLIVKAKFGDSINLKVYAFIGWGFPAILTVYWTVVKSFTAAGKFGVVIIAAQFSTQWFEFTEADDILHRSRRDSLRRYLSVLFLIRILGILIDELRSPKSSPYRTAIKFILMLISLVSNLTLSSISQERKDEGFIGIWHAIYISTQGCCLLILHCLLNAEVVSAICAKRQQNIRNDTEMNAVSN